MSETGLIVSDIFSLFLVIVTASSVFLGSFRSLFLVPKTQKIRQRWPTPLRMCQKRSDFSDSSESLRLHYIFEEY